MAAVEGWGLIMKGYTSTHCLSPREVEIFELVTAFVAALPERDREGAPVRCHEVARAVARYLDLVGVVGVQVVDGRYFAAEHTWLVLGSRLILDTYAVARLPVVQLILPWFGSVEPYQAGAARTDINEGVVTMLCARGSKGGMQ